jgi:anti-repressor protein
VIFNFGQNRVRTIVREGEPWFVAVDVCKVLGYIDACQATRQHCKASEKVTPSRQQGQVGGAQSFLIIPERDLYRLVMRSKLPTAERFEEWVVAEVLPQIRKTGGYQAGQPQPQSVVPQQDQTLVALGL